MIKKAYFNPTMKMVQFDIKRAVMLPGSAQSPEHYGSTTDVDDFFE